MKQTRLSGTRHRRAPPVSTAADILGSAEAMMSMTTDRLLAQYRASGRPFIAGGSGGWSWTPAHETRSPWCMCTVSPPLTTCTARWYRP
jgi:hypothetical protein